MSVSTSDLTIRKSVVVPLDVDAAFALFTEELATWWPVESHSIHHGDAPVVFERRVGGELYERAPDGRRAHWATVLAWSPPHEFVLEWKVSPDAPATQVHVRFAGEGDGTRVDLEHRGWERYGAEAAAAHADYDGGWDVVLGRYVDAA